MARFAENTSVSVEKSRSEIEATLRRYGATSFVSGWNEERSVIGFQMKGKQVKFFLPLPDAKSKEFAKDGRGSIRSPDKVYQAWEQACRQKWRALALVIKAKLEAVAAGITVFEDEFLAHIVLPDGQTVGQVMRPQIELAYREKTMPPLLPHYK